MARNESRGAPDRAAQRAARDHDGDRLQWLPVRARLLRGGRGLPERALVRERPGAVHDGGRAVHPAAGTRVEGPLHHQRGRVFHRCQHADVTRHLPRCPRGSVATTARGGPPTFPDAVVRVARLRAAVPGARVRGSSGLGHRHRLWLPGDRRHARLGAHVRPNEPGSGRPVVQGARARTQPQPGDVAGRPHGRDRDDGVPVLGQLPGRPGSAVRQASHRVRRARCRWDRLRRRAARTPPGRGSQRREPLMGEVRNLSTWMRHRFVAITERWAGSRGAG
ncbi:hypothetical protein BH18ACI1_BH18ACI1_24440 [soil metagenome]